MKIMNDRSRIALAFVLIFAIMLFAVSTGISCSPLNNPDTAPLSKFSGEDKLVSSLPASLLLIDDQAFWGTALEIVCFDRQLYRIGEKAFWNIDTLTDAYIAESTEYIGHDAFPFGTVIHGVKDSYAQQWAEENGYQFAQDDIWNSGSLVKEHLLTLVLLLPFTVIPADADRYKKAYSRFGVYVRSMRPHDRPELYPINYRFP